MNAARRTAVAIVVALVSIIGSVWWLEREHDEQREACHAKGGTLIQEVHQHKWLCVRVLT